MASSKANNIGEAYVQILANFEKLEKQLDEVKRKTEKSAEKAGKSAGGKFEKNFTAMIGKLGLALGAMFAAGKLKSWLSNLAQVQDQVQKLSIRLGETTNFLSEMQYVAELSGVSVDGLNTAIEKGNRNLAEFASSGIGEASEAFRFLGIEAKNTEGRLKSFEELLPEYADKFAKIEDDATKVNLAFKLFGRSGTSMLQVLASGKDGIAEMRKEAQRLGISLDRDAADKTAKMNDTITTLNYALRGLGYEFLAVAGDPITALVKGLTEVLIGVRKVVDAYTDLSTWQYLTSKQGLEYWKDYVKAFVTSGAGSIAGRLADANASAVMENLEALKAFYEQVEAVQKKVAKNVGGGGDGTSQYKRSKIATPGEAVGVWRGTSNAKPLDYTKSITDYYENIRDVETEYFTLIDTFDAIEENHEAFWQSLKEDTQAYIDAGDVMYESLIAGFDTMFDDLVRIQTDSNNTLIKGFTAMANAFIQQVQRMIVQWLAFKAVQGLLNMVLPGSGDLFAKIMNTGRATGGEFYVPPGYPHDSYIMGLSSGERVQVTPSGQSNNQEKLLTKMINRLDILASHAGTPTGSQTVNIQGKIDGYDIKLAYDRMNKLLEKVT